MTPLRKARIKKGLTIYQVARKAGVTASIVSRIERGYSSSSRMAERLARAVGNITEEQILYPNRFNEDADTEMASKSAAKSKTPAKNYGIRHSASGA